VIPSSEFLQRIRERVAQTPQGVSEDAYIDRAILIAEVDRLRSALDFAERAAADRLGEDERWLAGWKAAREQAVSAIKAKHNRKFFYTSLDPAIHAVEEMQP
jgi:hypothetical protein